MSARIFPLDPDPESAPPSPSRTYCQYGSGYIFLGSSFWIRIQLLVQLFFTGTATLIFSICPWISCDVHPVFVDRGQRCPPGQRAARMSRRAIIVLCLILFFLLPVYYFLIFPLSHSLFLFLSLSLFFSLSIALSLATNDSHSLSLLHVFFLFLSSVS